LYLKDKLEQILTKEYLSLTKGEKKIAKIVIADIVFAFNNTKIIKFLKKRGQCIVDQDFETQKKIENEIVNIKNKDY